MCYAKPKIIVEKTPAETCINKFCTTHNVCIAFRKLQLTFLGPCCTQHHTRQRKEELCLTKYKEEFKHNNLNIYVAHYKKIYQQMQKLKTDGFAGIDPGTCIHYFLVGIDKSSLKTTVQICKS